MVQTAALRKNKNEAASNPVAKPFDSDIGSAISDWLVSQPAERNSSSSADEWALISPSKPEPSDPEMVEDFFIAVKGGSIRMASILFKLVDINTQDLRTGRTALSFAAENGNVTMARLLLENGASVHIRQYSRRFCAERGDPTELAGRNALIWAATGKHTQMVWLLLQNGANPNSANTLGQSALLEACSQDDEDTFRLLVEHGADINFKRFYYVSFVLFSFFSVLLEFTLIDVF